uniref:Kinesin-like protein n=1 Tax=Bionectria ochroleuca TaxID=29856 RepID=A0A8H7TN36_BIOOC
MEEKHIKNAAEGIKVLQDGSLKRQVAATKCNDLSSRSHTVFTISTYVKKPNENGGDDYLSAGKLNLVDLAGSENIQRSGAENKRAAEAGLINKSLLTLGRVINALVDRSAHIPYRESKLTRILQDSLGGRTKTCIIATISPAKGNLEETISTLDYAFRAKNIKNKPQTNPLLNKKTLLKEFSHEIEKLKSELISTRQRNGVYLSNEAYEEMTAQSETRRIVMEEQTAKMETLESNLRNRVQDLHALNVSFIGLKKDHDGTKEQLDQTKNVLDQTEIVLSATKRNLDEETQLRKAHQETEGKLAVIGGELIDKLNKTVHDVSGLHSKNRRKSDLQSLNRTAWGTSQGQVAEVTTMIERRIQDFQDEQKEHISSVSRRMEAFVQEELQKLTSTQAFLDEHLEVFGESKAQLIQQEQKSKDDMDKVLEEIKETRDSVKERVGESLQAISKAAEKISADIVSEMATFHNQLHTSYSTLGKDCKTIFDELVKHITTQRSESDNLRRQLQSATNTIVVQNATISSRMQEALEEERRQAADDRQKLMVQITGLINAQAEAQETRIAERATQVQKSISDSNVALEGAFSTYAAGMDSWDEKENEVLEEVKKSRDQLKTRLKDDWNTANDRSTSIQNTAKSVHAETVRVVDEQVEDLDSQMEALDDFVTRAKSENTAHHESYSQSLITVSNTVDQSFGSISGHFKVTFDRVKNLGEEMEVDINDIQESLEPLETQLCRPLANLREEIASTSLQEYQPTGDTPQKVQYHYPTSLPRTQRRSMIIPEMDEAGSEPDEPAVQEKDNNTMVFADLDNSEHSEHADLVPSPRPSTANTTSISLDKATPLSLREVDPNVSSSNLTIGAIGFEPLASHLPFPSDHTMPLFKHSARTNRGTKKPNLSEGRENVPISALAQGTHRRKSPRLN